MKLLYSFLFAAIGQLCVLHAEPVKVIFDTDMCGDVDDALALAMLHTMADRGECELLAVTASQDNPQIAPYIDAVNTFYGRPDIPIGDVVNGVEQESKYLKLETEKNGENLRYPHDIGITAQAEKAVPLLRRTLAAAQDKSIVFIQVGFATNLAQLLDSQADAISPLTGKELIAQKVRLLSLMAGSFQTIRDRNRYLEYNVIYDIPAMQKVADEWPSERVWSGFEIGIAAPYPRESVAKDFEWQPKHIVKESYLLYSGPEHDRPTWDLTSVLYAVRPERGYFDLSSKGQVKIQEDGFSHFITPGESRGKAKRAGKQWKATPGTERDRFLTMSPLQAERVTEAFVQLVSQPPRGR